MTTTTLTPDADALPAAERLLQTAGLLLFGEAALFMTAIMLASSMAPGYSLSAGAISDLGSIPATANLFNWSLLAVGVLNVAGGFLLYRATSSLPVLVLFLVAGAGAAGAGLFTLGTAPGYHGLFALAAFVGFNLMPGVLARRVSGPLRLVAVAASVVGLSYVGIMIVGDSGNDAVFGPIGHGGAERMIVYPPMLWLMAFGGYLMASASGKFQR